MKCHDIKTTMFLWAMPFFIACLFFPRPGFAQEDWSQKGVRFLKAERFDDANRAFSNAIAEGYNNRGVAWQYRGDLDRAIEDYNKALEIFPEYFQAYNNRGVAFVKKGEYKLAMADFSKALELNPDYSKAYYNRGYVMHQQGDFKSAITDFGRAIEISPGYAQAYNARGLAWDKKGDFDKAIADYTKALEIDSSYAEAYNKRGAAWAKKGDFDKAIPDYTEAIRIKHDFAEAYYNRAVAWHHKKDCKHALDDLTEAIDIAPNYAEAFNQIAWTRTVCKDDRYRNGIEAVKAAEKAVELKPEVNHFDTLAAAHAEAGQFEKAIATQEKAIAMAEREGNKDNMAGFIERLNAYKMHKTWNRILTEKEYDVCAAARRVTDTYSPEKKDQPIAMSPRPVSGTAGDAASESNKKVYSLQIGAFSSEKNAARLTAKLREKGYDVRSIPMTYSEGRILHTVLVGRYTTIETAKRAASAFYKKENVRSSIRSLDVP